MAYALAVVCAAVTSGCQAVEGIFKAGFWVGAIVVIAVLGIVVFAIRKLST